MDRPDDSDRYTEEVEREGHVRFELARAAALAAETGHHAPDVARGLERVLLQVAGLTP